MDGIEDMRTAQKKAVEARKALLLYEPWMDNKAKSPSLHDFVDSPGMFPKMKPRSQYRFDKEYVRSISKTPTAMTVPPLLTPPPMGPPPIQQVPVAIKKTFIQVPVSRQGSPKLKHVGSMAVPIIASKTTSPIQPTTAAVVSPPPVNEPRKSNFGDYYKWLWNGREDDIDPVEIEKMLFKTRPSRRKK